MAGLYTNQNSDSAQALSDLVMQAQDAILGEQAAVETLEKLRLTNVQKIAKLRKEQEYELINTYTQLNLKAAEEIHNNDLQWLEKEKEQRRRDAENMSAAEFKRKYKYDKKLLEQKIKEDEKRIDKEFAYRQKKAKKAAEQQVQNLESEAKAKSKKNGGWFSSPMFKSGAGAVIESIFRNNKDANGDTHGVGERLGAAALQMVNVLGDYTKQLNSKIEEIGNRKGAIDTRLQGSSNKKWDDMSKEIMSFAATSPIVKQSAIANRVQDFVGKGIAFNVEQRAILQELSGKIATTFDAANGTLSRLIRIQQQDTTAGRLGMESALTAFLNNMYETTEYMSDVANSIKGSLEEAMSLMSGENAMSFEYQVQKWLGSMYSVGMSQNSVQGLGGVLGKLASGQLDAITSGGQGNLVIMAANNAGMNISDILSNGLTADTTNELMNSMVDYLAKIYEEAGDSKVIQQQMASIYGMTASDLKAAVNLSRSRGAVSKNKLSYSGAMKQLEDMASSMSSRTSMGEMMSNVMENLNYSMANGIATNPALYGIYKAANMLTDMTGGIDIATPLVMGSGMPVAINVANVLRTGALAGGLFSNIGGLIHGMANGTTGWNILKAAGVGNGLTTLSRGGGQGITTSSGATVSESGTMIGNTAGGDAQNAALTSATDSNNASTAAAVEETEETKLKDVRSDIIEIYNLLKDFSTGTYTLPVEVKNTVKIDEGSGGVGGL